MKQVIQRREKGTFVRVEIDIGDAVDGWAWGDAIQTAMILMSIARDLLDGRPDRAPVLASDPTDTKGTER